MHAAAFVRICNLATASLAFLPRQSFCKLVAPRLRTLASLRSFSTFILAAVPRNMLWIEVAARVWPANTSFQGSGWRSDFVLEDMAGDVFF